MNANHAAQPSPRTVQPTRDLPVTREQHPNPRRSIGARVEPARTAAGVATSPAAARVSKPSSATVQAAPTTVTSGSATSGATVIETFTAVS